MSGHLELTMVVKRTFVHAQLTHTSTAGIRRSRSVSDLSLLGLEEDSDATQCFRTCKPDSVQASWDCATSLGGDSDVMLLESDSDLDASEVPLSSRDPSPRPSTSSSSSSPSVTPPGSFSCGSLSPVALSYGYQVAMVPVTFALPLPAAHAAVSPPKERRQRRRRAAQGPPDGRAGDTTLILKNLPEHLCRDVLLRVLDDAGFGGRYDFVYLPTKFSSNSSGSYCYGFINMVSHKAALDFIQRLDGFSAWPEDTGRAMQVLWSDIQGQRAYIEKYRNSTVMHESVPDFCKPALFNAGSRVPFPSPTLRIKAPRLRDRL